MSGQGADAGLHITVASRAEDLLPALFEHLADRPTDPFAPQYVVVPNVGISEWVQDRIADEFGVAANVELLFPGRFRAEMLGTEARAEEWEPRNLLWAVLETLRSDPTAAPGFASTDRPLASARRIAELFDRYAVYRPAMVRQWATGSDANHRVDDDWTTLPDSYRWQPDLWRRVRERIGTPSRAEEAERIAALLDARADALPPRVALFGATTLGGPHAGIVKELARRARVDVMLLAPSPRRSEGTAHHPLVTTWSVPSLETIASLANGAAEVHHVTPAPIDGPMTHLRRVQGSIHDDAAPDRTARTAKDLQRLLAFGDGTIQVHGCHGAVRQVEALRDAILHLMVDDPTLAARDILVVAPDLERFAPLVGAVLGAEVGGRLDLETHEYIGSDRLVADLRDASLTGDSDVATVVRSLMAVVSGRATASEVLGLLALEPVLAALARDDRASDDSGDDCATRIADEDLERIARWTDRLGIRWGLDGADRVSEHYPTALELGTWREAVDRLLVGAFVRIPTAREIAGVVPHDDLTDQDLRALGLLTRLVDDLIELRNRARGRHSLVAWSRTFTWIADRFLGSDGSVPGAVEAFRAECAALERAGERAPLAEVDGAEIVDVLVAGLVGSRERRAPRRDSITVCSALPRRGVPARVVAILGFDERAVQRAATDGDDILALHREAGEPDRALEQRQSMLDAILAARDHLIITHDAHSPRDNRRIPPPIALEELLETIADEVNPAAATADARPVVIEHTRQLTHPVNLGADPSGGLVGRSVRDLVRERPWTFEESANLALRATSRKRDGVIPVFEPEPEQAFKIRDLADALTKPAYLYLHDELGVTLPGDEPGPEDDLAVWPDALLESVLGRELLDAMGRGSAEAWRQTRARLGGLPPGEIATAALDATVRQVTELLAKVPRTSGKPRTVDIDLRIGHGEDEFAINDRVDVVGTMLLRVQFAKWDDARRVHPLIELACVMLTEQDKDWMTTLVTRPATGNKTPVLKTMRLEDPEGFLRFARDLRAAARRGPVGFLPRVAWALHGSPSTLANALRRDLYDRYTLELHGRLEVADLTQLSDFAAWETRFTHATAGART